MILFSGVHRKVLIVLIVLISSACSSGGGSSSSQPSVNKGTISDSENSTVSSEGLSSSEGSTTTSGSTESSTESSEAISSNSSVVEISSSEDSSSIVLVSSQSSAVISSTASVSSSISSSLPSSESSSSSSTSSESSSEETESSESSSSSSIATKESYYNQTFAMQNGRACVIDGASLRCWGQIGSFTTQTLANPKNLTLDSVRVCVIDEGVWKCWPFDSDRDESAVGDGIIQAAHSEHRGCVLTSEGQVECSFSIPEYIAERKDIDFIAGTSLDFGVEYMNACAIYQRGISCFGNSPNDDTWETPELESDDAILKISTLFGCVLDNQKLKCFGVKPEVELPGDDYSFTDFAINHHRICGVDLAGTVSCWGLNGVEDYQFSSSAVRVVLDPSSNQHGAAANVCVLLDTGNIECRVRSNVSGYLTIPKHITSVQRVFAGQSTSCVESSEEIFCWGEPYALEYTEDGVSTIVYSDLNDQLNEFVGGSSAAILALPSIRLQDGVNGHYFCAATESEAKCFGSILHNKVFPDPEEGEQITDLSVEQRAACIVYGTRLHCLGIGGTTITQPPEDIGGVRDVELRNTNSGCAITTENKVRCWGITQPPVPLRSVSEDAKLLLTGQYGCIFMSSQLDCWSLTTDDVVKNFPKDLMVDIQDADASSHAICYVKNGGAECINPSNGTVFSGVPEAENFTSIDVGYAQACATTDGQGAVCWGLNNFSQATAPSGFKDILP